MKSEDALFFGRRVAEALVCVEEDCERYAFQW